MRARYYNVDIKRFINQDVLTGTLERISSLNRYAYVEGNPVSFLDPFGLEKTVLDRIHDTLQIINAILIAAACTVAAIVVLQPQLFVWGIYAEYNIEKVAKVVNMIDRVVCVGIALTEKDRFWEMMATIGLSFVGYETDVPDLYTLEYISSAIVQNIQNILFDIVGFDS